MNEFPYIKKHDNGSLFAEADEQLNSSLCFLSESNLIKYISPDLEFSIPPIPIEFYHNFDEIKSSIASKNATWPILVASNNMNSFLLIDNFKGSVYVCILGKYPYACFVNSTLENLTLFLLEFKEFYSKFVEAVRLNDESLADDSIVEIQHKFTQLDKDAMAEENYWPSRLERIFG